MKISDLEVVDNTDTAIAWGIPAAVMEQGQIDRWNGEISWLHACLQEIEGEIEAFGFELPGDVAWDLHRATTALNDLDLAVSGWAVGPRVED